MEPSPRSTGALCPLHLPYIYVCTRVATPLADLAGVPVHSTCYGASTGPEIHARDEQGRQYHPCQAHPLGMELHTMDPCGKNPLGKAFTMDVVPGSWLHKLKKEKKEGKSACCGTCCQCICCLCICFWGCLMAEAGVKVPEKKRTHMSRMWIQHPSRRALSIRPLSILRPRVCKRSTHRISAWLWRPLKKNGRRRTSPVWNAQSSGLVVRN